MKFSSIATTTACVLIIGAIAVSASRYGQGAYGQGRGRNGCGGNRCNGYANGMAYRTNNHLNNGYGNNNAGRNSAFGPYHSYAVRPALYGGHGMYNYYGYSRHYPAPPVSQYRRHRNRSQACHGPNCRSSSAYRQNNHYGLRPVKALALVPTNNYRGHNNNQGYNRDNRGRGQYSNSQSATGANHYRSNGNQNGGGY